MNLRTKKIITWFMSLLFVASLSFSSFNEVLCIDGDGHAKVESICQQDCDQSDSSCLPTPVESKHEHESDCDECDDCYDLPLDKQGWLRLKSKSNYDANYLYTVNAFSTNQNIDPTLLVKLFSTHKHFIPIYTQSSEIISISVVIC